MPRNKSQTIDHTGQPWPSESDMCRHWGVSLSTYKGRLSRGWTREQALTVSAKGHGPKQKTKKKLVYDHTGQGFVSISAMCRHWHLDEKVYWSRKRICKWPLERILTEPVHDRTDTPNAKSVTDHTGQIFPSVSAMCRHWHIGLTTYRERVKRGWPIEKALTSKEQTIKTDPVACVDHTGEAYPSKSAMCAAWGVKRYCYDSRIALGWTVQQALTENIQINAMACQDHTGKTFPAANYMALYLGFPKYTFQGRNKNMDVAIRAAAIKYWADRPCGAYDIKACIKFPWFLAMDRKNNTDIILHFDQLLQIYHKTPEFQPLPESNMQKPFMRIVKLLKWPWYLCSVNDDQYVLHYDDMLQTHVNSNYGLSPANLINKNKPAKQKGE